MEVKFDLPAGYWLEGLSEVRPEGFWRVYLRTKEKSPRQGDFLGATGRTPQEALDKAKEGLEKLKRVSVLVKKSSAMDSLTLYDLDL